MASRIQRDLYGNASLRPQAPDVADPDTFARQADAWLAWLADIEQHAPRVSECVGCGAPLAHSITQCTYCARPV